MTGGLLGRGEVQRDGGYDVDCRSVEDVRSVLLTEDGVHGCVAQARVALKNANTADGAVLLDEGFDDDGAFDPGGLCGVGIGWHAGDDEIFLHHLGRDLDGRPVRIGEQIIGCGCGLGGGAIHGGFARLRCGSLGLCACGGG